MKDWLGMDRREFLTALGATYGVAATAMAAPRGWFLDYAGAEDAPPREAFVNALCSMCPGGCGVKVRTVHGYAVGIRGNVNHPINRGGLCSRASAMLQDVYNPDRLQQPKQAVGGRGSGRWQDISWDEAIDLVASKLSELRGTGPQGLCAVLGRDRGLMRTAWTRFMRAFGSPNLIDAFPDDNLGVDPAVLATQGIRQRIGYDVANASYVLSFASGWLDAHWSTEQAARGFAEFRRGRPGFRPKWVHVGPRFSLTAVKADEWIGNRTGTDGVLALGLAHVMVREGLYDRAYVDRFGSGFEDWNDREGKPHLGFRRFVLQEFEPTRVQAITGVPEGELFPGIAIGYDGGGCGRQSAYDRMAIHCLNALNGSIDVVGGVTVFPEFELWTEDAAIDDVAKRGLAAGRIDGTPDRRRLAAHGVDLLADALDRAEPYAAGMVWFVDADPVFELASGQALSAALKKTPFVVASAAYETDTARCADLILPTMHGLHRWDFNVANTLTAQPVVTLSRPVMDAPPDSRDPYAVLRSVAVKLGDTVAAALPWEDGEAAVDEVCQKLFERKKGAAFGPANEESWARLLESRGWRAPFATDFASFREDLLSGGGWTDPIYFHGEWDRIFRSPPGQFAFSSRYLARSFEALPDGRDLTHEETRCLPDCAPEEVAHDEAFPLELYVYALPNLVGVSSPNLPWLNDIAGAYMFEKWRTWAEIHPETAERLGIEPHDHVEVRTSRGSMTLPVKIYAGLVPEVVAIPFGFGRRSGGRWCAGIGRNPAELVDAHEDPLTGASLWNKTRASIRKV